MGSIDNGTALGQVDGAFEVSVADSRQWCQPGDVKARTWLVTFEDQDRTTAIFHDEREARDFFKRADQGGWNCYLFQAAAMPS